MTQLRSKQDPDEHLGHAVDEFLAAMAAGNDPDLEEYASRYPQIADLLKVAIPAILATEVPQGSTAPVPMSAGKRQLGDFRLMRQLGRGGMGIVYEAEQVSMARRVALKVLPLAGLMDDLKIKRFKNEVRAVAALEHPNIVSVYMVGEENGVHYYAMQLVRGSNLAQVIESLREMRSGDEPLSASSLSETIVGGPLLSPGDAVETDSSTDLQLPDAVETVVDAANSTLSQDAPSEYYRNAASMAIQAANALEHAHEHGIVHRDIKPGNLLLDRAANLFLTDFGLARIEVDAGVTMTGDLVGTLRYMAPEQALGKRVQVDHRADIYSLAATLYELLALRPAYDACDRQQLLKQIAFDEPMALRRVDPGIPKDLETIVHKAMSKDVGERYQTAQELADDLRNFLDNRPIDAKPPSLPQIVTKWTRRNPAIAWTSVITLLLVTVVFGISTLLVIKQRDKEVQASNALRISLYASEMNAAYQAWAQGNPLRVHRMLGKQVPNGHEQDLRGLEWNYLAGLCIANQAEVVVSADAKSDWCLSPDGKALATVVNGAVILVDLATRRQSIVVDHVKQPNESLEGLAFSQDGERLAIAAPDGLKVVGLSENTSFQVGTQPPDRRIAFSRDGKWGASVTIQGVVQVWDAGTGKIAWSKPGHGESVGRERGALRFVEFSPDSQRLITAYEQEFRVMVWDVGDGRLQPIVVDDYLITQAVFVDNERFILGGHDGLQLIRIATNHQDALQAMWLPKKRYVTSIALSADGTRLALGTERNKAEVWDLTTRERLWHQIGTDRVTRIGFGNHPDQIIFSCNRIVECNISDKTVALLASDLRFHVRDCLAVHGTEIAVAGPASEIVLWNPIDNRTESLDFKKEAGDKGLEENGVVAIDYAPDGRSIASACGRTIRIWNAKDRQLLARYRMEQKVTNLAYAPSGGAIAAATNRITLLNASTLEALWVGPPRAAIVAVCFSPDGKRLVSGGGPWYQAGQISIWNVQGSIPVLEKEFEHNDTVLTMAISPDGRWLVAGDYSGTIVVYDLHEVDVRIELAGHPMAVQSFAFSPDGKTLVSAGYEGSIKFWQMETWNELGDLQYADAVQVVRFMSPHAKGVGFVVGTRRAPNVPADLQVQWIDTSADWERLRDETPKD